MALADDIELLVFRRPGLTEAKELFGNRAYQQRVNSTCRRLIRRGRVVRHENGGPGTLSPITQGSSAVPRGPKDDKHRADVIGAATILIPANK